MIYIAWIKLIDWLVHDEITCKIMTEPDFETKISTSILKYQYLIGVCSPPFASFFCCFHTKTDYLHQIYRDTQHFTLYNGTVPVCLQQRTGAFKWHVTAAVVQKLTPVELRPFCYAKGDHYKVNSCLRITFQVIIYRNSATWIWTNLRKDDGCKAIWPRTNNIIEKVRGRAL